MDITKRALEPIDFHPVTPYSTVEESVPSHLASVEASRKAMVYKFDHIGITVRSLMEAQERIAKVHPCFHAQNSIEARNALKEVSIHKPDRLSISLHRREKHISIELIEYPLVSKKSGSILPCWYDAEAPSGYLKSLKNAIRKQFYLSLDGYSFADIASLLAEHAEFNAVVIPVEDLSAEEHFWQGLRFKQIYSDSELVILTLKSLIPPAQDDYIVLYKVDFRMQYYTDMEGINEVALLCHSCSADLKAFPQDVFKSSVDTLLVDGKKVELGYLRSPSGVLAELLSVRLAIHER